MGNVPIAALPRNTVFNSCKAGITGIAPNSEIYSYRVLDDDNCAPISRVVEAIYMAIDREVNIINSNFPSKIRA